MDPIPRSQYHCAKKIALISIKALEDVMGKNGMNASPVCWGRIDSDKPVCFIAIGLLQAGLK